MKNNFFYSIKSKIVLSVKGHNLERFIKRLAINNIELLKIKYIKYDEVNLTIYKKDYDDVINLKTIYEISIVDEKGLLKLKKFLIKNIYFILSVLICYIILKVLTYMVFEINIVHNDKDIREIISSELKIHGIKKYSFIKSYDEIQKIKEDIISKYKDKIEWIEIENVGVKYIVRVQERNIIENNVSSDKHDVVSKKSAILKSIKASSGTIVKNINDYVGAGDVVISSEIKLNDELKDIVDANGKIYGEVWYSTTVEYPFTYHEVKETGNKNSVYSIKFLSKYINIFDFNKYENSIKKETILFSNNILPIHFVKLEEKEIEVIDEILTEELAVDKAYELSLNKMKSNLKEDEYIIKSSILKTTVKEDKVILEMFFSVYEDITDYRDVVVTE